jgi:MFS transporter, PPP family, 3-phenylpropionic acid transporter
VGHGKLVAQIIARYANDHHDIDRIAIELMPFQAQIPIPSAHASRRFARRLALFYGAVFTLIGTHLPFFPLWLRSVGIDASWIGIITAVPAVTRFTVLPWVTGLAERRSALRGAMIVTAIMTTLGFSVVGTQERAPFVFLAYIVTASMWTPMVPLTDAYALRGVARYGLKYGPLRLWGSAAFVLGALVCGLLVDKIDWRHLIWVIIATAALGAVLSLGLQPLDSARKPPAVPRGASALLRDPRFLVIIAASALIQGSHAAYYTFASITWELSGLGGLTIAALWALGVIAEIVVFALSPRLKWQPSVLVVIGALSAVARWLITAQEPPVAVLAIVQLAHGLTFGNHPGRHHGADAALRADPFHGARAGLSRRLRWHSRLSSLDPFRRDLCPLRAGGLLRDGRDGAARCRRDVVCERAHRVFKRSGDPFAQDLYSLTQFSKWAHGMLSEVWGAMPK